MDRDGPAADEARLQPVLILSLLLALTLLVRIYGIDQPIVENYVGRQIPTAMAARNLDRGSGFLRPQLDTGPFPNYFVVEPPLYEQLVVWLKRAGVGSLTESGRLLSAVGITLVAWGLFDLAKRREGTTVALLSVLALAAFPVTVRFGRAFQPDALMLGLVVLGLAWWDRGLDRSLTIKVVGWLLLAAGLALKITSAYILVPLIACLGVLASGTVSQMAGALDSCRIDPPPGVGLVSVGQSPGEFGGGLAGIGRQPGDLAPSLRADRAAHGSGLEVDRKIPLLEMLHAAGSDPGDRRLWLWIGSGITGSVVAGLGNVGDGGLARSRGQAAPRILLAGACPGPGGGGRAGPGRTRTPVPRRGLDQRCGLSRLVRISGPIHLGNARRVDSS